jgi:hypothetical protein
LDGVSREVAGQKQAIWFSDLEEVAEIMFNLVLCSFFFLLSDVFL